MAKNLATLVKSVKAGAATNGVPETVCRANVFDFWGPHGNPIRDWNGQFSCAYSQQCIFWCVPHQGMDRANNGANKAKFEIWGGGGYPSGISNCGAPPPSGAGAYAYKTIDVSPGDCYMLKAGFSWCCLPNGGGTNLVRSTECRCILAYGTWVTGTGLTNFCAEPGRGSTSMCCHLNSTTFDSDGAKWWTVDSGASAAEAQYYGADGGATGKLGWQQRIPGATDYTNPAAYMQYVPYSGGIVDAKGGHMLWPLGSLVHATNICCYGSTVACQMAHTYGIGSNGASNMAGRGQPGGHACAGVTHCGALNSPGRVKITYWRE